MESHSGGQSSHTVSPADRANGRGPYSSEGEYAAVELYRYATLLWQRRWLVFAVPLLVALAAGLTAEFVMRKVWRAEAVVTPVSPSENMQSQIGGSLDALGGAGGLSALLGFAGQSSNTIIAQRYIAIMSSYAFTMSLVERYHLAKPVIAESGEDPARVTPWKLYNLIHERFQCDYDYKSGNLSLFFLAPNRDEARRILGSYLENLRDKLRNEEIQSSSEATKSLQDEVRKTSDALLQNQLYELMARQIQHEKLAQVQADFAFKLVEPPVVPDRHYSPRAMTYFVLSGSATFFLLCVFLLVQEWISNAKAHMAAEMEGDTPSEHRYAAETVLSNGESRPSQ